MFVETADVLSSILLLGSSSIALGVVLARMSPIRMKRIGRTSCDISAM